jgi:hypothetical protein
MPFLGSKNPVFSRVKTHTEAHISVHLRLKSLSLMWVIKISRCAALLGRIRPLSRFCVLR